LKHIYNSEAFEDLKVPCKQNIKYKNIVADSGNKEYRDFTKYNLEIWKNLINAHLRKVHYIVNDSYSLPSDLIPQIIIFLKQLEKYIKVDSTVAVLSAFPIFIHDYYGNEDLKRRIE
jgi:hypothetical protein